MSEVDPRFDARYQRGDPARRPAADPPRTMPVRPGSVDPTGRRDTRPPAAETALGVLAVLLLIAGGVWLGVAATRPEDDAYTADFWTLLLRSVRAPLGSLLVAAGLLAATAWAAAGVIRFGIASRARAESVRFAALWLLGVLGVAGALAAQALSVASLASRRELVADIGTRAPAETEVLREATLRAAEAAFGAALVPCLLGGVLAIAVALVLRTWLTARRRSLTEQSREA